MKRIRKTMAWIAGMGLAALMSCAQPSTKESTPAAAYDINLDSAYQAFP